MKNKNRLKECIEYHGYGVVVVGMAREEGCGGDWKEFKMKGS